MSASQPQDSCPFAPQLVAQESATHLMLTGKAYNLIARCLQGIVEQYRGSSILEVQARSCEYSHMFKLDGMRAALLEHIPPLDESTYTRNLGNSQVIDGAAAAQVSFPLHCLCCCCCHTSPACHTLAEVRCVTVRQGARRRCCGSNNRHGECSQIYHCCCQPAAPRHPKNTKSP